MWYIRRVLHSRSSDNELAFYPGTFLLIVLSAKYEEHQDTITYYFDIYFAIYG